MIMDYKTSDLGLIAALATYGVRYKDVDTSNIKRIVFTFTDSYELRVAIEAYFNDALPIDSALRYFSTIKTIKSLISNAQRNTTVTTQDKGREANSQNNK